MALVRPNARKSGFTLLELLVVIGIIALLISILLPALSRARRAAYTVKCLANLRSIGQAMNMYAAMNKGWLPGSGWTTGRQFFDFSSTVPTPKVYAENNCPDINEPLDWVGPLSRVMGIHNADIDGIDSVARYKAYRSLQWMVCPAYTDMPVSIKSGASAAVDAGPGQGLSYCTSINFLCQPWASIGIPAGGAAPSGRSDLNGNLICVSYTTGKAVVELPAGYGPRLGKVGDAARKVYAADGSRAATANGSGVVQQPYYQISGNPANTGWDTSSYADMGAFGGWSHSCYRIAAPGNATNRPPQDVRIWALRHGTLAPYKATGSYRMNVVFFDGHGETLDEIQASNPALWIPAGSIIHPTVGASGAAVAGTKTVWSDAQTIYCQGITSNGQTWTSP